MPSPGWKECPQCSLVAGRAIWRHFDEFGTRRQGGVAYLQSWCRRCRGQKGSSGNGKQVPCLKKLSTP